MSGKNFMSYGDADTILTEFSNDIKSRVSTKANQGLTAQQMANAKANIDIDKVPNVATNDQTPTFLEESTRTNIASGDKLSLIFGKIKKFFSDLKTVAFTGSYADLSNTPDLSLKADKSLLEDGNDHFQFGVDANGNYGYHKTVGGADTVIPFKTVGTRSGAITTNGTYTAKTDISKDGYESVTVSVNPNLQSKTVTAGTTNVTVSPDASYDGLSSVVVQPTPSQTKSVTPSTSAQTVTPDSGKYLSSVSVGAISTQTKSATPSTSAQTVSPDSGKFLSSVSVAAIPNLHTTNSMIVPRWGTGPGSSVPATRVATLNPRIDFNNSRQYGNVEMVEIAMPEGYYAWSYGNSSCCIPTETKTVTAGTSATTVTPTEYNTANKFVKFLKSVTVNPTPSQAKETTASTANQVILPDSGKLLSQVTVWGASIAESIWSGSGSATGEVTINTSKSLTTYSYIFIYGRCYTGLTGYYGVIGGVKPGQLTKTNQAVSGGTLSNVVANLFCMGTNAYRRVLRWMSNTQLIISTGYDTSSGTWKTTQYSSQFIVPIEVIGVIWK